ncbi:hypothetical protein N7G274_000596 [Stereocaulon virgatum]|uniref:Uncharacterized protein n=1 Tax=Stereocaulon virgatum TaxID=373712 RepID=A0ABR4AT09_9LECA
MVQRSSQIAYGDKMPSSVEEVEDSSDSGHPRRRPIGQRKSSVSEAFNKFTTNTFSRKRSGGLPSSTSTASINPQSRLPTPSGIPRSSSFFSSLNSFATKSTSSVSGSEVAQQPLPVKRSRKISERLAQTPFFSLSNQYQNQQRVPTAPITPKTRRESAVKIEQHGLMQPIHPPLPRSATMGNLGQGQGQQSSPHTPSYMRPTSSSAARRGGITSPKQRNAPITTMPTIDSRDTPPKTPTKQTNAPMSTIASRDTASKTPTNRYGYRTPTQKYPIRKDSLPSAQASAGLSSVRYSNFSGAPLKSSLKPLSAKAAGKLPMIPDMTILTSGGQDSGVAFTGDEEVQRQFDENVRRTTVLSDREINPEHIPEALNLQEEDDSYEGICNSDEHNKLCRVNKSPSPEPRTQQADPSNPRQVFEAQGQIWWLGRYTALHDRFRTSSLPSPPCSPMTRDRTSPSPAPSFSSTDSLSQPMHDDARRTRRVYIHLRSLCMTDEAKQSLDDFKTMMDARERKIAEGGGKLGPKIREKRGFFQGLMGKKKGEGSGK